MKRLAATAIVVAALVGLTAERAPASTKCLPTGSRVLASGPLSRVYELRGRTYGCAFATRKPVALDDPHNANVSREVQRVLVLAETRVVVEQYQNDNSNDVGGSSAAVFDLRARRVVVTFQLDPGEVILKAVVAPRGGAAFLLGVSSGTPPREIFKDDCEGPKLLDSGSGLALSAFTIRGSVVTWTKDMAARSYALC